MASPHASSFICLPFSDHPDIVSAYTVYFSVCTGSAVIGVVGAALFLAQVLRLGKDPYLGGAPSSQRCILVLLAVSDVCADLGVIARSVYWLAYYKPRQIEAAHDRREFEGHLGPAVGGAILESWVYFWYLATYFWTFFFAVDVYNSKHGGKWKLWCSHTVTWTFCLIYVAGSVASLWGCPPYSSCTDAPVCVISHFMCTFGPIVVFMIALPIFYVSAWKQMKKAAAAAPAVDIWKTEKKISRRKILSIILVFYLCWIVNVVDGVGLITVHALQENTRPIFRTIYSGLYSYQYIYVVWLLEAILNPLQGLLNAVAYGNLGVVCYGWLKRLCSRSSSTLGYFSGEYIDVDFRVGRSNIHSSKTSKRRNSNS